MNDKIPYIKYKETHYKNNDTVKLKNSLIERIQECVNESIGKPNNETTIAYLQSEVDYICGGKRLFEVRKKYDKVKKKAKLWGIDTCVDIEEKVLIPYELELVWVGNIEDIDDDDLMQLIIGDEND